MITQEQIEQIRKRHEAATPGPWRVPEGYSWRVAEGDTYICNMFGRQDLQDSENAEFIAHARTDIPLLLDEIDRLSTQIVSRSKFASDDNGRCWHSYYDECDDYNEVKAELAGARLEILELIRERDRAMNEHDEIAKAADAVRSVK